jgi:hypothetical protein
MYIRIDAAQLYKIKAEFCLKCEKQSSLLYSDWCLLIPGSCADSNMYTIDIW